MNIAQAIFLGVLQGVTEFLPISSSGHLVMAQLLLGVKKPGISIELFLHVGTLFAVLAVYGRDLWEHKEDFVNLVEKLMVAMVPTIMMVMLLKTWLASLYSSFLTLGLSYLVTTILLWSVKGRKGLRREVFLSDALWIGLVQGLAVIPGLSRSGSTIVAGVWRGLDQEIASRFSFLLSIPTVFGALIFDASHLHHLMLFSPIMLVAFFASFVSGYVAIRFFLQMVQRGGLYRFWWYTLAVGLFLLLLAF